MIDEGASLGPEEARLLAALGDAASELTGFSREAILTDTLRRAARELLELWPPEELLSRAHMRDPQVTLALRQAVSVGETFFFRQPEHFGFLAGTLAPEWLARGGKVRVWSAGCATGEEPYSLAALLVELLEPKKLEIDVLGTDLLTRNLQVARAATYGAWSQRPSAPLLAPILRPAETPPGAPALVRVIDRVREKVRFHEHNLLEPSAEAEPFDLILCRNVLVYFAPDAAARAIANLTRALAPGGVLMLGSMDLNVAAPEMIREAQPEQLIFRKPRPGQQVRSDPGSRAPAPSAASSARVSGPGALARNSGPGALVRASGPGTAPRASNPGETRTRSSNPGVRSDEPGFTAPPRRSDPGAAVRTGESRPSAASPDAATLPDPISLHLRALLQLERGELEAAERTLQALLAASPGYLPGLLERALLHQRRGEPAAATQLIREVHRRASALPADQLVPGPEPLQARFYVESAEAFLRGGRP